MISTDRIRRDYVKVAGNEGILKSGGRVKAADLHTHTKIDAISRQKNMLEAAALKGVDLVAVTNHDQMTRKSAFRTARKIRDNWDIGLEIIPASEATIRPVRDPNNRNGKHVLVLGQTEPLDPFISWYDLAASAWRQKAKVIVAHPDLGDISLIRDEIEIITEKGYAPNGIEIQNGSEALIRGSQPTIDKVMASRLPEWMKQRFYDGIPQLGSNKTALNIANEFQDVIPGRTAGSDAHSKKNIGDVLVLFPENMQLFDAMETGEILIVQLKEPEIPRPIEVIIQERRGGKIGRMPKKYRNAPEEDVAA
ncbi:MAG TPA: hypothetical protein VLG67_01005 [Candidatus Saccharimonadales bacterium]|nr:hypothetical protein [Candidatus Saccharimonadales bacterium]